jgi:hypothetical protein
MPAAPVVARLLPALMRLLFSSVAKRPQHLARAVQAMRASKAAGTFGSKVVGPGTLRNVTRANSALRFAGANAAGVGVSVPMFMGLEALMSGGSGEEAPQVGGPSPMGGASMGGMGEEDLMRYLSTMDSRVPLR